MFDTFVPELYLPSFLSDNFAFVHLILYNYLSFIQLIKKLSILRMYLTSSMSVLQKSPFFFSGKNVKDSI